MGLTKTTVLVSHLANATRACERRGGGRQMGGRYAACVGLALSLAGGGMGAVVAGAVFMTAPGEGATNDWFDVSQGAQVIFSTPQHNSCCGNSDPRMALGFGALPPWIEPGHAIFADGPGPGSVDQLEWQTAGPVNLARIRIWLAQDGAGNPYRGASAFRLLGSPDGMTFSQLSGGPIPLTGGANVSMPLLISDSALSGITTNLRAFRLELTRLSNGGPRLIEIDGFGTAGGPAGELLDRLAFNAASNQLTGRGDAALDDEGPGLATGFAASSRRNGTDTIEDAFGQANGSAEPGTFSFGDAGVPDNGNLVLGDGGETVDSIDWVTLAPVALAGYQLDWGGGAGPPRGAKLVRFVIDGVARDFFDNNGVAGAVLRRLSNGPVTGERFRLELTRSSANGPCIVEIDALIGPPPPMTNGVVLNEVVAFNDQSAVDEDGDSPAWIELMNASEAAADLAGWGLSDDPTQLFKWRFPALTLPPHAYLVVFASGKNRTSPASPLHTNFKLDDAGEAIRLTRPAGMGGDGAPAVRLRRDVSLGRSPNAAGPWRFFGTPTPGRSNGTLNAYDSLLFEPPAFSPPRGFYPAGLALTLASAETNTVVRFTLDGSEPTEASPAFTAPLPVASRAGEPNVLSMISGTSTANQHTDGWKPPLGEVGKATVVRARAFRPGALPGPVATHTYFIGPDAVRADRLPVLSIATATNGLFDYETGIYRLGANFDRYVAAHPDEPLTGHTPANYTQRGPSWERAADVEFFGPDGRPAWSEQVALDIQGQSSRSFRQKSFGLKARGDDGRRNTIEYPIFPGLKQLGDGLPLTEFQHLRLRNAGNDWDVAMMRDDWCHRLVGGAGLDVMSSRPVVIYLDGEYWGVLTLREQQDAQYVEQHYGVDPKEVAILYGEGALEEGRPDDAQAFRDLRAFASTHDLAVPLHYEYVRARLDVDDFLMYQLCEIYFANADWPQNNMRMWRRRLPAPDPSWPRGQDGRWRWFLFDVDLGAAHPWSAGYTENTLAIAMAPAGRPGFDTPWATAFLRALLGNPDFKRDFINTAADLLNSWFRDARTIGLVNAMEEELRPAMAEHIRRWQSCGGSVAAWQQRVQVMRTFAMYRSDAIRQHFTSAFALAGPALLTLDVSPPGAGTVRVNRLVVNTNLPGVGAPVYPWRGVYFRNLPITIEALPAAGTRFVGWTGLATTNRVATVTLTNTLAITANFVAAPQDLSRLLLTEIHYHPPAWNGVDGDRFEFLELKNVGPEPLNLTGLAFTAGVDFAFTNGTTLAPGAFLVLASGVGDFLSRFPNVPIHGEYAGKLDNAGETLTLSDPGGAPVWSVAYDDTSPWPVEADGGGLSLQRVHTLPAGAPTAAWCAAPPTPGADVPSQYRDTDGDGLPDAWELAHELNPADSADADRDLDGDGLSNRQEFLAGTDPRDDASALRIEAVFLSDGGRADVVEFTARSNRTYAVQARAGLEQGAWTNLAAIASAASERRLLVTNTVAGFERFYRLVTPGAP